VFSLTPKDSNRLELIFQPGNGSLRNKPQGKESRLLPSSRRRGVKHESTTFSEARLPQLQGDPSQRRSSRHLQGSTSQAAAGLIPDELCIRLF
jgi:hypothetical protein